MELTETIKRKFVYINDVSKFLYCPICGDIFRNPIRLENCGHTYCWSCIFKWFKYNKYCPICRAIFTEKDIKADIIATNIINDLEIYCTNSGCPWKGKVMKLSLHL